jgi:large subunit ribosomal protein L13
LEVSIDRAFFKIIQTLLGLRLTKIPFCRIIKNEKLSHWLTRRVSATLGTTMTMNRAFFLKTADRRPSWRVIDAQDKVLGRLATHIANALRGKDKPEFTKHSDAGDYIVVINAEKIKLTGNKLQSKIYQTYSGYIGNRRETTAAQMLEKRPTFLITKAVKNMLPKNRLSRQLLTKLKVYAGDQHPHTAQVK